MRCHLQTGKGFNNFSMMGIELGLFQVQAVVQDSRCHELMNMYEQQSAHNSVQDIIRYRRQAELLVGSDDLFRIDWVGVYFCTCLS